MKHIVIDGRKIGPSEPPYIIAEVSANHNGDIDKALKLIEKAKDCGADAVKIQTYTADTMTLKSDKEDFKIKGGTWDGYTLHDLYEEAHTPWPWHKKLFEKAKEVGITIFSSPFDETAVDFLEELSAPAFKVASFELVDLPLIDYIAKKKKPIIISTGMASKEEIQDAIAVIKKHHDMVVVLHCISGYPTPLEQSNLGMVPMIRNDFEVLTGLSDHTLGTAASVAAVSLGACLIEKHFTDKRSDGGLDSTFSLEPSELSKLVEETKSIWNALREPKYQKSKVEEENKLFRRSIYFVQDLKKGDQIQKDHIRRIRPGFGLSPKFFDQILNQKVTKDVTIGTATSWENIEKAETKT